MRSSIFALCWTALFAGCATTSSNSPAQNSTAAVAPVITPDLKTSGKIVMVNSQGRFVVVTFPIGVFPEPDRRFNVYHAGLKVGEVKIADWKRNGKMKLDTDTVADLIAGDAQVNDEVREN